MLEGRHYQNAYVTRDLDKGVERLRAQADIRTFFTYEGSAEIATPAGRGLCTTRLAFLWVDDLQIELIQPVSGLVDIYSEALPADDGLKFHHICMRVDDWDDFRARVDRQPFPVVIEGGDAALRFLYLDARSELGHYLEYTWMTDERWAQFGGR